MNTSSQQSSISYQPFWFLSLKILCNCPPVDLSKFCCSCVPYCSIMTYYASFSCSSLQVPANMNRKNLHHITSKSKICLPTCPASGNIHQCVDLIHLANYLPSWLCFFLWLCVVWDFKLKNWVTNTYLGKFEINSG